ncbi:MAG: hypothetical protein K8R88_01565 [Armatimonadetes bacterium]|nr:hypothetical protein [Armatimonadota bacterium]
MAKFTGSVIGQGMSGAAGSVVFVSRRDGINYIKPRTTPRNPQTPLQQAARARMTAALRAYQSLSLAEMAAWREFTARYNDAFRRPARQSELAVCALFQGLGAKFLQVSPSSPVPTAVPGTLEVGDVVRVSCAVASPGVVRVSGSQANAAGMVTEILLQPLASAGRQPRDGHYRTAGFHIFSAGALTVDFPVRSRFVGVAARFVCAATGQATAVLPVGVVEVGG